MEDQLMDSHGAPIREESDTLFDAPPMAEQERMVEAVLFASTEPVTLRDLEGRMPHVSTFVCLGLGAIPAARLRSVRSV